MLSISPLPLLSLSLSLNNAPCKSPSSRVLLRPFICPYHPLYPYRTTSGTFALVVSHARCSGAPLLPRPPRPGLNWDCRGVSWVLSIRREHAVPSLFPKVNSSLSPPSPRLVLAYQYHVRFLYDSSCSVPHYAALRCYGHHGYVGDDRTDLRLGLWASTRPKQRRPSPSSSGHAYWMVEMLRLPFSDLIVRFHQTVQWGV